LFSYRSSAQLLLKASWAGSDKREREDNMKLKHALMATTATVLLSAGGYAQAQQSAPGAQRCDRRRRPAGFVDPGALISVASVAKRPRVAWVSKATSPRLDKQSDLASLK
jgi:hypothetical protein